MAHSASFGALARVESVSDFGVIYERCLACAGSARYSPDTVHLCRGTPPLEPITRVSLATCPVSPSCDASPGVSRLQPCVFARGGQDRDVNVGFSLRLSALSDKVQCKAEVSACASSVALRAFINSHSFASKLDTLHLAKSPPCCADIQELKQSVGNPDVPANNDIQKVRTAGPSVCHSIQCFRTAPIACFNSSFSCLHGSHSVKFPFHTL